MFESIIQAPWIRQVVWWLSEPHGRTVLLWIGGVSSVAFLLSLVIRPEQQGRATTTASISSQQVLYTGRGVLLLAIAAAVLVGGYWFYPSILPQQMFRFVLPLLWMLGGAAVFLIGRRAVFNQLFPKYSVFRNGVGILLRVGGIGAVLYGAWLGYPAFKMWW